MQLWDLPLSLFPDPKCTRVVSGDAQLYDKGPAMLAATANAHMITVQQHKC